tara:strand:- start:14510 stop:15385 length:876 start_codon:yes stop_codon:yes gene_type:complete
MNKTIIISSGGAVMRYKNELSQVCRDNNISTFAFSTGFMYCVNELNIYPDYFAFIDPNSAMPALEHIIKNKEKIHTKVVLLDPIHNNLDYNNFIKWCGTTPVGRGNFGGWERFRSLVNSVKQLGLAIEMPCYTLKHIYNNISEYKKFEGVDLVNKHFNSRFDHKQVIIKNQLDPNFNEDKLTSIVLPILEKLGIYDISLIGFDCQGGRYAPNLGDEYTRVLQPEIMHIKSKKDHVLLSKANRGMDEAKQSINKYLPLWLNSNKFTITNLVEDEYTFLKKYITHQPIKDLTI